MNLRQRALYAVLKRHKLRQRNGLWCEPGCPFHTSEAVLFWRTVAAPTGVWTFMYCHNVDQMMKEGMWE